MRSHAKVFLFGLFMVIGLTWVGEASAFIPSGGSRLLFYFSQRSFTAGAADNTAQTLLFITNGNSSVDGRIAVTYYRGNNCGVTAGPFSQNLVSGATATINVADQVPADFQEGVAEVNFVNGVGARVRNDFGAGHSIVIDQNLVTIVKLPAALLHSDDRVRSFDDPPTLIANNAAATSWAPTQLLGQFEQTDIVRTRLSVFSPGTIPGTPSADTSMTVRFRRPDGGGEVTNTFQANCGFTRTLAQVRGQTDAQFQAAFPTGGAVAVEAAGQEKGMVGWLIQTIQLSGPPPVNILFGQVLQGIGVQNLGAHP